MSLPYEYTYMPHILALTCPNCAKEAFFEFPSCVKISLRKDIPYFESSEYFEYRKVPDHDGTSVNLAFYFHKLHGHGFPHITDLPEGYEISDWGHTNYHYRQYGNSDGTVFCISCGLRRKHTMSWPDEAYFQITYKGKVLWSYDRRHTAELLDYIGSKDRERADYKYRAFLLTIPSYFQARSARAEITKRLSAKLHIGF